MSQLCVKQKNSLDLITFFLHSIPNWNMKSTSKISSIALSDEKAPNGAIQATIQNFQTSTESWQHCQWIHSSFEHYWFEICPRWASHIFDQVMNRKKLFSFPNFFQNCHSILQAVLVCGDNCEFHLLQHSGGTFLGTL